MAELIAPSTLPLWATVPNLNGIIVPSSAKQQLGWAGPGEKPPYQTFNWWQNLQYLWTKFLDENNDRVLGNLQTIADITIATGSIAPVAPIVRVRTEAAASTDSLDTIDNTELSSGRVVVLFQGSSAEKVTVTHGIGNISLRDGLSFTFEDDRQSLILQNRSGTWTEISRTGPKVMDYSKDEVVSFTVPVGRTATNFNSTIKAGETATIAGTFVTGNLSIEVGATLDILSGGQTVSLY